jgi:hypothetical protein
MSDDYAPGDHGYSLEDVCDRLDNIEAAVEANHANHTDLGGLVGLVLIWLAVVIWVPDLWNSKLRISLWYSVGYEQVTIQKEPTDCNFFHAPMGNKDCHYDRQVSTVRVGTNQWGGQSISYDEGKTWTQTAKSQNGDPIVSNDGGKSWSTEFVPPLTKPEVVLSWEKKDDE